MSTMERSSALRTPASQHPPRSSSLPRNSTKSSTSTKPKSALTYYLIAYNGVSAALWATILIRVLILATGKTGWQGVFGNLDEFVRMVQTLAGLEVGHSAAGLVRSPLFTSLMQVASRFLLVWGIALLYPATTSASPAYTTMLLAWSVTEIIRYSYFVINLAFGSVPDAVTWLRYNTFLVLYPLGIGSECWLIWKAAGISEGLVWWALVGVLGIYVPGSYVLFGHMVAQRRKVMRTLGKRKA